MILRPYQQDFVTGVARGFADGFMRQLGVLPTGGGKTIVFAHIANRFHAKRSERTLVLAHREELIAQAADKIAKATGLIPTIEKASQRADRSAPVVVASIQTMQGDRLASWPVDHFGLIVCDEAHHVLADQWQTALSHFSARVLGVTATPDRGDRKNLAVFFDNLAYECGILQLIKDGFLSPVKIQSVPLRIDLAEVKSTAGDFDANALDAAIRPYLSQIARHLAEHCGDRKKIVTFLPLISTSQAFVAECQSVGIDARHIDGASPDRAQILADYSAGKFRLLSNAMLLTEGWDEPGVDCLLVLRPTRSRSLYAQMVGRGTRRAEGKDHLLLLDFLWLHERHDLARPASLVAKNKDEEKAITGILEGKDGKDLGDAVEDASADREAALIRAIAENARRRERFVSIEQVGALLKDEKMRDYEPVFGWEKQAVTEKQRAVLDRFGVRATTKGEAARVMDRLFDRSKSKMATVKQLVWLARFGHPNPQAATCAEAKAFLDEKFKSKTHA
jgi:superfamily II DNA or RNA helicase